MVARNTGKKIAQVIVSLSLLVTLTTAYETEVFTVGEEGYRGFRIPGIISAGKSRLIAVAEGRKFSAADFGNEHDVVAKRSDDNGQTWSPLMVVGDATVSFGCNKTVAFNTTDSGRCQFWDPTPVYDNVTDEIHILAYYTNDAGLEARLHYLGDVFMWTSKDGGKQWSPPRNLSHFFPLPRLTPANGHGIQLHRGNNRLLLPAYGLLTGDNASTFATGIRNYL